MSLLGDIIGSFQAPAQADTQLVTFAPYRSIGGFTAQVTVSEEHQDELTITDHPVEQGANISDHAFKNPSHLMIKCGWSNSGNEDGSPFFVQDVYQQLLDLQASRTPFDVYTGKRVYNNMMIQSLGITTDAETENALMVTCHLREVLIVQTQTTTLPPVENQANPQKTQAPVDNGTKQPKTSDLYNTFGGGQ